MVQNATAATWFLIGAFPICLWVAWSDLRGMRIPNKAVVALFAVFAVTGLFTLPFDIYLWRYSHLAVVLAVGFLLNMGGLMGAGDAKFLAAAAPMVAYRDFPEMVVILSVTLFAGFIAHRIARATPLRRLAPEWQSWSTGQRFPMGYPLAGALVAYLVFCIWKGLTSI